MFRLRLGAGTYNRLFYRCAFLFHQLQLRSRLRFLFFLKTRLLAPTVFFLPALFEESQFLPQRSSSPTSRWTAAANAVNGHSNVLEDDCPRPWGTANFVDSELRNVDAPPLCRSLKRDDRFAARNAIMDEQTEAGLPGPGHKLAATGLNPAAWEILAAAHYLHIYILNARLLPRGPILGDPLLPFRDTNRRNLCCNQPIPHATR